MSINKTIRWVGWALVWLAFAAAFLFCGAVTLRGCSGMAQQWEKSFYQPVEP